MNQLVVLTAETAMRIGLAGHFMAWNEQYGRFQMVAVNPDFIPAYQENATAFGKAITAVSNPWSDADLARLIELRGTGMLWREVGKELGRSKKACCSTYINTCRKRGIQPVMTVATRRTMTATDRERAIALRAKKMSSRNIASALGLTQGAVASFLSAHTARLRLERFRTSVGAPQMTVSAAAKAMATIRTNPGVKPVTLDPGASNALAVIQNMVCDYFCMHIEAFIRGGRGKVTVRARHIFFYIARKHLDKSFPQIGRACGGADHTTVMHGVAKVQAKLADYADDIAAVERALGVTG